MKCNYFYGILVFYIFFYMKDYNKIKICLCNVVEIVKWFNVYMYIDLKKKFIKILFLFLRSFFNFFL